MDEDEDHVCRCGQLGQWDCCPYTVEIGGVDSEDEEHYCNCCERCRGECAMDI